MKVMRTLIAFLLLGITSAALAMETAEPAPAFVPPVAVICVEAPGTSEARPCSSWCSDRIASHVLRFMRIEQDDGAVRFEWRHIGCEGYLAERRAL
jgi:hypothetical protein